MTVKRAVIERDKGMCRYCGKPGRVSYFFPSIWVWMEHEFDHVLPEYLGGKSTVDNIVTACQSCNRRKGHKTLDEWGEKLLPIPGEDYGKTKND
jgi:5-methylcytosine-specific restriction endonuclease McrA